MPTTQDYIDSIFSEIIVAASREDLRSVLKTCPPPASVRDETYRRLKIIKPHGGPALRLSTGGFVARQVVGDELLVIVSTEQLNADERNALDGLMVHEGGEPDALDIASFCNLAFHAGEIYRIKTELRSQEAAEDQIDLTTIEGGYKGHELATVMSWFEDVSVYKFERTSRLFDARSSLIAALLGGSISAFRSPLMDSTLASKVLSLVNLPNVNPENVYLALTSQHWKHAFIEIYRLVEALYYLPWVLDLRAANKSTQSGLLMARQCRSFLDWREREESSIRKLFGLLPDTSVVRADLISTSPFSGIAPDEINSGSVAERIYKIRNQLIHQEDYEERSRLTINDDFWPVSLDFLIDISTILYATYAADAAYVFSLSSPSILAAEAA